MNQLFKDLRVLDLSTVLAGPSVATFFAELGAEVTKIENPKTGGDVTRTWKLPNEQNKISAYWSSVNYKKNILFKDLSVEEDLHLILDMISKTDILISNFKKGDDVKFGLQPEILKKEFPRLIQASISGFHSRPDRVAYDVVLQAETGFMYMNGDPRTEPLKMPIAMIDVLAAHQLKEAILCALYQREKNGLGTIVKVTLEKAGISALVNQASNYLMANHIPQREGSLHPNIAPYGETFCTKDNKWLVLAIGSDQQFKKLCSLLGLENLPNDEQFKNNSSRVQNRTFLASILKKAFADVDSDHIVPFAIEQNIPLGIIKTMDAVFENQSAQSMILEEEISGEITRRVSSIAFEEIKMES